MNCYNKSFKYFIIISLLVLLAEGGTRKISDGKAGRSEDGVDKNNSEPKSKSKSLLTEASRGKPVDNKVQKITENISNVEEQLKSLSKDLVSSIMKKFEVQDRITKLATETLKSTSNSKGMTALQSRRVLDYISREVSGQILKNTRSLVQPELQKLVYSLCQTAAEIAIMSSLKDISWTKMMAYAHHERGFSLRRKREILNNTSSISTQPNIKELSTNNRSYSNLKEKPHTSPEISMLQSELFDKDQKKPIQVLAAQKTAKDNSTGRFLNNVIVKNLKIDTEDLSKVQQLVLENKVDPSVVTIVRDKDEEVIRDLFYQEIDLEQEHNKEESEKAESLYDSSNKRRLNAEILAEMDLDVSDFSENRSQNKKAKHHTEKLETKAEKALKFASDVAYLTASTVVAARRAITSQMEVQMAVKFVKNGLSNHQGLMINLAKSAAKKAGSEAKSAYKKSVACDRALGVAMKYTAQSHGAKLNNLATRIIMDTVSAASIARSMSLMASKAAMESMFAASEIADA